MTLYRFVKRLSDKIVGLSSRYGDQLWSTVKLRKTNTCSACERSVFQGAEAWSPITNVSNRMERICGNCIERLERRAS